MEIQLRNDLKNLKIGIAQNNVKLDDFYTKVLYKKTPINDINKSISITECIELIKKSKNQKVINKYKEYYQTNEQITHEDDSMEVSNSHVSSNISKYVKIKLIDNIEIRMCKDNGFINTTEMCTLVGKEFHNWYKTEPTKKIIEAFIKNENRGGLGNP